MIVESGASKVEKGLENLRSTKGWTAQNSYTLDMPSQGLATPRNIVLGSPTRAHRGLA